MLLLAITCKILQSGFLFSLYVLKAFFLTLLSVFTVSCLCFSSFTYAIDLSVCCNSEIT